jgi:hypothetical protein
MTARKTAVVIPFAFVFGLLGCPASQAQESSPTQFSVGFKVWHASWQSYVPGVYSGMSPSGSPALGESYNLVEGSERTDVLPLLAIRHGNVFASASYGHFSSNFSVLISPVVTPGGTTLVTSRTDHFVRRESDISLGYLVTPEVGLTIGYKDATESRTTALGIAPQSSPLVNTKVGGLLLGAIGSFPVQGALRLYTQLGYGPARLRLRFVDPSIQSFDANGRYLIGEVGLSYPLFTNVKGISAATAAIGYRTQTVKTASRGTVYGEALNLRDVREGLVFSLNVTI